MLHASLHLLVYPVCYIADAWGLEMLSATLLHDVAPPPLHEEEERRKICQASASQQLGNKADHLCQSWQSCPRMMNMSASAEMQLGHLKACAGCKLTCLTMQPNDCILGVPASSCREQKYEE